MAPTEEKKRKKEKKVTNPSPEESIKLKKKKDKKRPRSESPVMAPPPVPDRVTGEKKKKKKEMKRSEARENGSAIAAEVDGRVVGRAAGKEEDGEKKNKKRDGGGRLITDPRFASAHFDPRFQRMPKREAKITVDSRFRRMLTDDDFATSAAPVDKRGKRRKGKNANPLLQYYLHQEDEEGRVARVDRIEDSPELKEEAENGSELEISAEEEEEEENEKSKTGEEEEDDTATSSDESSSTDDEDVDDDEYSVNSDIAHYLMANHEDTPMTDNETHRLAVVNLDWDHIKAVDLYVIMNSCLPKGGQILSVAVYPSEFGLKCMKIEAVHGPSALLDEEENSEDDSDVVNEKFRSYELSKLRYYHAVVVCDSSATANHLYKTLDGTELLKTSNVFDLRFIPDSMEFKHPPRDIATEAPMSYKEPDFETRALQHSKVKLTWEEDEPERKKILRRKFNPDQLDELNEYLASTTESDEDDEDVENYASENDDGSALQRVETKKHSRTEKLRALLQSGNGSDEDNRDDKDMEITFNTELEDLSKRILEKKDKKSETVWEAVLRKRSEKKKARKNRSKYSDEDDSSDYDAKEATDQPDDFFDEEPSDNEIKLSKKQSKELSKKKGASREGKYHSPDIEKEQEASKAELELLFVDEQGADKGPKGYNLKPKKVKRNKGNKEAVEDKLPNVNVDDDPRFSALFKSPLFALDPTDSQYKRSAEYRRQKTQKQKKDAGERKVTSEDFYPSEQNNNAGQDKVLDAAGQSEKEKNEFFSAVRSLKRKLKS